jgi:hypothetical protein
MSEPFFSQGTYSPPGTYITESQSPLAGITSINPEVVAIVGPSRGYRTESEAVALASETLVQLSQLGVDIDTIVVTDLAGAQYDVDVDYELTQGDGEDEDPDTRDDTMSINRIDGAGIANGETVRVSYQYTDEAYFEPLEVLDFDDAKDAFGEPIDPTTSDILSPLTFAAKFALDNGANRIILVPTDSASPTVATRTELTDAYAKIAANPEIGFLVPLSPSITGTSVAPGDVVNVASDLATHTANMAEDGFYRFGFHGQEKTGTVGPDTIAEGAASKHVLHVMPNKMYYYNGFANQTIEIDGFYLAAALAGLAASQGPHIPLTRKNVRGFSGIPPTVLATMSRANKNTWGAAGVAIVEPTRRGTLMVRHGVTTLPTSVLTREFSVVRARDTMAIRIKDTLDNSELIGSAIVADTPLQVKSVVAGVLETLKSEEIIVDYIDLKARVQSVDPSVIQIKYQYQPSYPLNYVVVTFSVNLDEGTIEEV